MDSMVGARTFCVLDEIIRLANEQDEPGALAGSRSTGADQRKVAGVRVHGELDKVSRCRKSAVLPATRYTGEHFRQQHVSALGPLGPDDVLPAVWCFCCFPRVRRFGT